ncbi:ABC transporter substrate-binding protein [uncultured Ruminococcus sp.]|uniref:ABC transporter substrate-binding protein n=1 Tax=uncultured Ruminococcus sp. TaxID=165186 RepID=UPI00292DE7C8|nr:ABC transporter substrate-binding protein [uncultured Ruminococcus sp.]
MKKRIIALATAAALAATMALTACGSGESGSGSSGSSGSSGEKASITIFNSKMEIQSQMEEMAKEYSEKKGVNVEVYYSSDTVAAHLSTRYAANDPYTISMVDAKDVYSLAKEHAVDLSDQDWVKNTTQAIAIDGKTYGFPVCVEARGVIYNGNAIEKATGKEFDPSTIKTTDDFKKLIEACTAGGMKAATGVLKEDWSLGAHYLAEVYEQHDDPDAYIKGIKDGSIKLADDAKFKEMMDTFDVLKENNYAKDAAISAEREVTEQKLAEGEIAFMFGGNWDWSVISAYDYTDKMGIMAVPNNSTDGSNEKLVGGGSKYFFIDSSDNTSDAQRQAAKDFLNWLVSDPEGQSFIVEKCALVPAFSNITLAVKDPLGASVKTYVDKGALIANYNYLPDDHYAKTGASFQKYLSGEIDRAAFADEVTAYWKTAEVIAH